MILRIKKFIEVFVWAECDSALVFRFYVEGCTV